jgi:hypothetical protein
VLKSIIFGNVHHYWYQNSNIDDYQHIIWQFASRLEACGHAKTDLIPILKEAFTALAEAPTSNFSNNTAVPDDTLFFHTEYHPRGVSRHDIHRAFSDTLTGHCSFDRFVIAYSRPWNLRDALTQMKLLEPQGFCTSDFL